MIDSGKAGRSFVSAHATTAKNYKAARDSERRSRLGRNQSKQTETVPARVWITYLEIDGARVVRVESVEDVVCVGVGVCRENEDSYIVSGLASALS